MPIDFQCPGCGRTLRVPDSGAGKKAKCPHCAQVVQIPGVDPMLPPGGSSPGQPQQPASPYQPAPAVLNSHDNPFASPPPAPNAPIGPTTDEFRDGPPWEKLGPSFNSFVATVKEIFGDMNGAFSTMRREGGLWLPLFYGVAGGTVAMLVATLIGFPLQLVMHGLGLQRGGPLAIFVGGGFTLIIAIVRLIFAPLFISLALFWAAGVYHLILILLQEAKRPFETTFRTVAYASGTASLLQIIPCVGILLAIIANIVLTIVGLSKMQEISTGKSALAVFLPLVLCICLCAVPLLLIFGVGIFAAAQNAHH